MRTGPEPVVAYVQQELAAQADSEKAAGMQAYMKTDMPIRCTVYRYCPSARQWSRDTIAG